MEAAGFVLAGGRSSRMGQDKALLEFEGETLVERALRKMRAVCAEVALAGGGEGLERFGRVIPDGQRGCGPLGGIVSALEQSGFEWNLFLAVDVPFVPVAVLEGLLKRASGFDCVCVMAEADGQVQPLCAAYARRSVSKLREELDAGRWKVTAAIAAAGRVDRMQFSEESWFRNVNTPDEFSGLRGS